MIGDGSSHATGFVASAPFAGEFCDGRLFAFGIGQQSWDQLLLTELVAAQVRARLEGRARHIHDGILQSLTAARLQLSGAITSPPAELRDTLKGVSDLLRDEQSRLREFVEGARGDGDLEQPLADLRDRVMT